ncbi:MAG: hypothetical protein OEY01_06930 [Desulfobulbaceae bacterium]|nr:hypothetical protein [Desulfobulbaceae bacterium]
MSREHARATATGIDSLSKGVVISMGVVSAIIGLWAVACLVGAMLSSNSTPLAMVSNWVHAITGM